MRRLALVAAIALALVAALVVAAAILVRPGDLRAPLEARLSAALGRPVALGEMDLALLPPAVRVRDVRVAGEREGEPPLAQIEEVRLRVAWLPLLAGRVVLGAVELDAPVIELPAGEAGALAAPAIALPRIGEAAPDGGPAGDGGGVAVAVGRLRVERGLVRAGPWVASGVELDARIGADGSAALVLDADVLGIASLRDVDARIDARGAGPLALRAKGRVEQVQPEALARLAKLEPELARGRLDGSFELALRGDALEAGSLALSSDELALVLGGLASRGPAAFAARLGGEWSADLSAADVAVGPLDKPAGTTLVAGGPLGAGLPPRALRDVALKLGSQTLVLDVELEPAVSVAVHPGAVDLAGLGPAGGGGADALAGTLRFEPTTVGGAPLAVRGALRLDSLVLPGPHGPIRLGGSLAGQGDRVVTDDLESAIGGQTVRANAVYLLPREQLTGRIETKGSDLAALLGALADYHDLSGTLDAHFDFHGMSLQRGAAGGAFLGGTGKIDVTQGRLRGFSIVKAVLGELAAAPELVARLAGKDLGRFDDDRFERLSADYKLVRQRIETENLLLVTRHGRAELQGWVNLLSSELDLRGRLVMAPLAESELTGLPPAVGERVIPISAIGGTLSRPRVRLDPAATAQVASSLLEQGKLKEKLEEKLGEGGAGVVQDVLEQLFRRREDDR
jgi:hypothetical protein